MKLFQKKFPPEFVQPLTPCNTAVDRQRATDGSERKRILIIRLGAHGDILMGAPLLTALRKVWPDAHLTWVVERNARDAIEAHPGIDEILLWQSSYWSKILRKGHPLFYPLWAFRARALRHALKARKYDVFISFQPEEWPFLVADVAAPTSIGVFDTFRQFYNADTTSHAARLYTRPFTCDDLPFHRTDQYLLPLKALELPEATDKRMQMGFTAEDREAVEAFLASQGLLSGQPFVALAPMTTWPSRCWPAERFAQLGDLLAERGCGVVLLGSARLQEQEAVTAIAARMNTRPALALGALSFRQMAALIGRASALVSGDTGPMHVAAAVGTPYVALFGPTPVAGRAPLVGRGQALMHPVPCGPCDQKVCPNTGENFMLCMKLLAVEEVFQSVCEMLPARSGVS